MVRRALPLIVILLAGCARSEDAAVVADRNELQPVERVRTPELDDEDLAIGEWRDSLQEDQPALEFGPTGAAPLFSLRCDPRRSIFLQRHGTPIAGDLPMMLVSVGSETRRLAVTSVGAAVPMLRASLAPSDTLIRTLADAVAPIVIRVGDAVPLALPPNPAIGGFLERCGTGVRLPAAAEGDAAVNNVVEGNEAAPAAAPPAAPLAER